MSIGPFSIKVVGVVAAILLAWLVARAVAKRMPDVSHKLAGVLLFDAVFWGLIAARLGYIAQWREDYFAAPMSMLAIGDGGFSWWVGVLAALAFVWWRTRASQRLRRPVLVGVVTGVAAWFSAGMVVGLLQHSPPLPDLHLATLEEQPISLLSYQGRPTVVNLWATWCPPCRREMPVFEQAQAAFPEVDIVMINQGESAQQAQAFLKSQGLSLSDVLLDPFSRAMHAVGARA
ncbi:MAG: TlpA disulfide reductase family protein, partial [Pseudomonas sp.]